MPSPVGRHEAANRVATLGDPKRLTRGLSIHPKILSIHSRHIVA